MHCSRKCVRCLGAERATRDVLTEFLAAYGKVPDAGEEEKRLGQMYLESTTGIIRDYGLPLTVDEYSKAMYPLYLKRFLFHFLHVHNACQSNRLVIGWLASSYCPTTGGKTQNRFRE